jgi:hypothetical protein
MIYSVTYHDDISSFDHGGISHFTTVAAANVSKERASPQGLSKQPLESRGNQITESSGPLSEPTIKVTKTR